MHDPIYVERHGAIAIVVLNRPEKLNAIDVAMFRRLREILEDCDRDVDLRCVIVRGADGRAFSVGGDISEFETTRASAAQAREYARVTHPAFAAIRACRHPVIASIEGLCVGGGLAVATLCDLRVCGESSRFGVPVKRLGLVESHDEMEPLVRLVGTSVALEFLLTGELMTAATALRVGSIPRTSGWAITRSSRRASRSSSGDDDEGRARAASGAHRPGPHGTHGWPVLHDDPGRHGCRGRQGRASRPR
jgi:enoyl-CoA hydratase